jgi:hypothetical protein
MLDRPIILVAKNLPMLQELEIDPHKFVEYSMKAKLYDKIQTLIDIPSDFDEMIIPKDTQGTIVDCYQNPEGYAIDLAIPNSHLLNGFSYENVVLTPEQFTVISYAQLAENAVV